MIAGESFIFGDAKISMLSEPFLRRLLGQEIKSIEVQTCPAGKQIHRVRTPGGQFCVKSGRGAAVDMLAYEVTGLEWIENTGSVRVPRLIASEKGILVTEWIDQTRPTPRSWRTLGESLARLHANDHAWYGFERDGFCGDSVQYNQWKDDGIEFFISQRIEPQVKMARDRDLLSREDLSGIHALVSRLPDLIPDQRPVLIHGDLWSGNVLFDASGPVVIDPAIHYGWAEADLAMTSLFGSFHPDFYAAYFSDSGHCPGFEQRKEIYNCYHLLNHLNLFGMAYHHPLMTIVRRFAR